jgi:hypothetical protein
MATSTRKPMTMAQFIARNRHAIDLTYRRICGDNAGTPDDEEREQFVLNFEELVLWARRCGVPVDE